MNVKCVHASISIFCFICIILIFRYFDFNKFLISPNVLHATDYLVTPSKVSYSKNRTLLNILKFQPKKHDFQKGNLRTNEKLLTIYVHGSYDMISKSILNYNKWEGWWLNQLERYLKLHPTMLLLDIGCNIGVYTLTAASIGNKVIAVDANKNNTDRLVQSVIANNLISKAVVLLNAVSDVRKEFSMRISPANIGSQSIEEMKSNSYKVKSILLDDLLLLLDNCEQLMMKIDIEQHEVYAFKKASQLFAKKNITLVLMEWEYVKIHKDRDELMTFLLSRKYIPFMDFFDTQKLLVSQNMSWPMDIVWRKS